MLDRVAIITEAGNDAFPTLRSTYQHNADLRVPGQVTNWSPITRDMRKVSLGC
ncbi:MAG: hypothetical protein M3Y74_00035 [Chloroflexota bacterium]|nr:hypothetical protein [Chloroflexota bacterium]